MSEEKEKEAPKVKKNKPNSIVQIKPIVINGTRVEFTKQKTIDKLIKQYPELNGKIEYIEG